MAAAGTRSPGRVRRKGGTTAAVVGSEIVAAYGGTVRILDAVADVSTTRIVSLIRGRLGQPRNTRNTGKRREGFRLRSVWDRSGPEDLEAANKTVEYLARDANRVAISNNRLIAIEGDQERRRIGKAANRDTAFHRGTIISP